MNIRIYFPDAGAPETSSCGPQSLSERWFRVCHDLLASQGPVLTTAIESGAAGLRVEMAGPIGRIFIRDSVAFQFSVIRGDLVERDSAALKHFEECYHSACKSLESEHGTVAVLPPIEGSEAPTLLLLDCLSATSEPEEKAAAAQFSIHLAAAYLDYVEKTEG